MTVSVLAKEKKESNLWSYILVAFGLNKASDFVVYTEEEGKNTLELKFISDADVANMNYDRL